MTDTIFAVSSGVPPAAIAILRITGPAAAVTLARMTGGRSLPEARRASRRRLVDPGGQMLDDALVLWFPAPATATGEDVVELHLHGGRAVIAAVEHTLARFDDLRPAEPGEFTRRALLNGRVDLTAAEGLGDLLMAETETQRRAAMASAEGAVARAVVDWSRELLGIAARVEALLDFADEDDVTAEAVSAIPAAVTTLAGTIDAVAANPPVDRLRDGIRVVLVGAPNAGKSTLLNALVEREAAIVSPIAGTTRDRIDVPVMRDGVAYLLTDVAGLVADTDDPIERIGVARAYDAIQTADILIVFDDTIEGAGEGHRIYIQPRADLEPALSEERLAVSALTGLGVQALWTAIALEAGHLLPRLDRLVLNRRQRDLCLEAAAALHDAARQTDLLLVAEQCRLARLAFDRITGAAGTEDMLDGLFARFCIGK